MPGDGHCLYHALAWWLGGTAHAMRQRLATLTEAQWNQFMPCNTPELLQQFRQETSDRTQWGGALQIAAAAAVYQVSFHVHSPFGVHVIGAGTHCHLWYSTAPVGHYDVWTEEGPPAPLPVVPSNPPQDSAPCLSAPVVRPAPTHRPSVRLPPTRLGGVTPHLITTLNVGGSRTALLHALHQPGMILLIQEHRHLGPGLQGLQLMARQAGWHGLWDPALSNGDQGRSGGTAVLIRRPLQIHRGTTLDRCTHGIVPWTRTQRLHLFSVYGPPCTAPQADETRRCLLDQLQETLAGIGGVPWLIGGDWNITPPGFPSSVAQALPRCPYLRPYSETRP